MSDYLNWYPGQRVVCVEGDCFGLVEGGRYTISAARPHPAGGGGIGIQVRELPPPPETFLYSSYWRHTRFRPLEPKAMQMFRDIAANVTSKKRVEA